MERRVEIKEQGVLSVTMGGIQTSAKMFASRAGLINKPFPVGVYVVDLTRAVACLTGEELDQIVLKLRTPIPGAIVVPQHLQQMCIEHARRMAAHGITRRVFTDPRSAMAWAMTQRALLQTL